MRVHSYVVEHDVGFAPNPFHGVCSLANCKPSIRKYAAVGDVILGFGSAKFGYSGLLVYWMKVSSIINFDLYWSDDLYKFKKPLMNGSVMQVYGDNIYHTDGSGAVRQIYSFHSNSDGSTSVENLERDTGSTNNVLLANEFTYYGRNAVHLPDELAIFEKRGIGHTSTFPAKKIAELEAWLGARQGPIGRPIDWAPIERRA